MPAANSIRQHTGDMAEHQNIPLVVDLDGTLIDSTENGNRAWTKWADEAGIVDRSFTETYHGRPGRQVLAEIVPPDQI